jgi:hypothetical protein
VASGKSKKVRVEYRRPSEGTWIAEASQPKGWIAWGRSLHEARANMKARLKAQGPCELIETIQLSPELREASDRYAEVDAEAAAELERVKERARKAKAEQVQLLAAALSLRDIGELLGLSQEGVRKILKTGRS